MANYNKVLLMGNITRDIELRHLPSGNAIAQVGLAVNRRWRDQNTNEMREETTFVDCDAFGKTAENIAKFFGKGRPIFIEGRLKLDTWKDKTDGSNRSKLKVVVESWDFIDSKPGAGGGEGGSAKPVVRPAGSTPAPAASYAEPEEIREDDIPF
ncbi:MAG: single-stranded DNA-binding protein [Phycisphaerales bacterium]